MDLAKRITDLRTEAGLSTYRLSKLSGIPQPSISRYESGENRPSVEVLEKICSVLGISLAAFFDDGTGATHPELRDGHLDLSRYPEEARAEILAFTEYIRFKYGL